MADFFRPELRALMWKYRDALIGLAMMAVGLFWGLRSVGILEWIGYGLIGVGILWVAAGFQRGQFRQGGDGPGVVQIRERRLAYFGPLDGGIVDIEDMEQLEFDPTSHPAPSWILSGPTGQRLAIPINAAGAEALFDVFTGLPGIKTQQVLDVLAEPSDKTVILWRRGKPVLH